MNLVMTMVVINLDHVLNIKLCETLWDHAHRFYHVSICVPRVMVIFGHLGLL
jgi:hypothetical protein